MGFLFLYIKRKAFFIFKFETMEEERIRELEGHLVDYNHELHSR